MLVGYQLPTVVIKIVCFFITDIPTTRLVIFESTVPVRYLIIMIMAELLKDIYVNMYRF